MTKMKIELQGLEVKKSLPQTEVIEQSNIPFLSPWGKEEKLKEGKMNVTAIEIKLKGVKVREREHGRRKMK